MSESKCLCEKCVAERMAFSASLKPKSDWQIRTETAERELVELRKERDELRRELESLRATVGLERIKTHEANKRAESAQNSCRELADVLQESRDEMIGWAAYLDTCDHGVILANLRTTIANLKRVGKRAETALSNYSAGRRTPSPVSE
jgi:chromosome segregation ATPase